MVPSVAITALTPPIVTINPLTRPATIPTATPPRMPSVAEPLQATIEAMQTVDMPTIEPTEMSSAPATITTVCAVARTPRIAMA